MWLVWLFSIIPTDGMAVDVVDVVEINHYYDGDGKKILTQAIYWDWNPRTGYYDVRDWRLIKRTSQYPCNGRQTWCDGMAMRRVVAKYQRETHTQYDPELVERNHMPETYRRKLTR